MALALDRVSPSMSEELRWLTANSRAPRIRTMRQFAEDEIIIPSGPFAGRAYRCHQPYTALWFHEVDFGPWNMFVATGPSQTGKTLTCSVIPILYHLFEIGETVIFGLPDMDMAADKWREDLEPVISRTRYRDLMPTRGAGSRGGKFIAIRFKNGAVLRFMTGGGGDKSRAAYTARVLVITETDGMDEAGAGSDESDKIAQLIARTRSFGSRRRIYMECTLTTKEGRTWREYEAGSAGKIMLHCPKCGDWVYPEREHLAGWKGAEDEIAASERAAFCCPSCAEPWSEQDRREANIAAQLVHRGQTIEGGRAAGPLPRTRTLGFRWTAANNLFATAGDVAAAEWRREREEDDEKKENLERELCQFIWAMPYESPNVEVSEITARTVLTRQTPPARGMVPEWATVLSLGCDMGARAAHWVVTAWGGRARGHICDYGVIEIHSDELGEERAIVMGLRDFRDEIISLGWGGGRIPDVVCIDSRWKPGAVRKFVNEAGGGYYATVGYGATQRNRYRHPKSRTGTVIALGDNYHVIRDTDHKCRVVNIGSDHWKSYIHSRITTPMDEPGAMSLFQADDPKTHFSFAKHLTSERRVEEFQAGQGMVIRWEQVTRNNHWLDALELSCVGAHLAGIRLLEPSKEKKEPKDLSDWVKGGRK